MIELDAAFDLMKKYGFLSTNLPPYLYKKGNQIGICYRYVDKKYGLLERCKFFDSLENMDAFLSRLRFLMDYGDRYNVRMILDNYEIENPKNLFLRNDKLMAKGEMFSIESFDEARKQEDLLDPVARLIVEAGHLLVFYDDLKNKRLTYSKTILELENALRSLYHALQKEVDSYNAVKMIRDVHLFPIVTDNTGINEIMENSAKERYLQYKERPPSLEEAQIFLKEIWDLLMNLEVFPNYFERQQRERQIHNEMRVVEAKLELMKVLNSQEKDFFHVDLMQRFRAINREMKAKMVSLDKNYVSDTVSDMTRKYSYFDSLELTSLTSYLNESMSHANYEDLVLKYHRNPTSRKKDDFVSAQKVSSPLLQEYKALSVEEQAILLLYHSVYRDLIDYLLRIPNLFTRDNTDLPSSFVKDKHLAKLKYTCYDLVKFHMNQPNNEKVRRAVFRTIDFTTFDTFLLSLIKSLTLLKNINNKMCISHDFVMYGKGVDGELMSANKYLYLTQELSSLKEERSVSIVTLKAGAPVLFCPYQIDFGNLFDKKKTAQFNIAYMKAFDLFIDLDDLDVHKNNHVVTVANYSSLAKIEEGVTIVQQLQLQSFTQFSEFTLLPKKINNPNGKVNNGGVANEADN